MRPVLRVVKGTPTDDELAAVVLVMSLASSLAEQRDTEQRGAECSTGHVAAQAAAVRRRTGQGVPGREPRRAPSLSRARWRSHEKAEKVATAGGSSARRRRAS